MPAGTEAALAVIGETSRIASGARALHMIEQPGQPEQEPVGIVISRGSRDERAPRFAAYVWGPAPTEVVEKRAVHAA